MKRPRVSEALGPVQKSSRPFNSTSSSDAGEASSTLQSSPVLTPVWPYQILSVPLSTLGSFGEDEWTSFTSAPSSNPFTSPFHSNSTGFIQVRSLFDFLYPTSKLSEGEEDEESEGEKARVELSEEEKELVMKLETLLKGEGSEAGFSERFGELLLLPTGKYLLISLRLLHLFISTTNLSFQKKSEHSSRSSSQILQPSTTILFRPFALCSWKKI